MNEMVDRVAKAIYEADGAKGWHLHSEFYLKAARMAIEAIPKPSEEIGNDGYDAGLLNDWGGGNVDWWQDYIRSEVERCNDYWRQRIGG
jgi:hypothetical protein